MHGHLNVPFTTMHGHLNVKFYLSVSDLNSFLFLRIAPKICDSKLHVPSCTYLFSLYCIITIATYKRSTKYYVNVKVRLDEPLFETNKWQHNKCHKCLTNFCSIRELKAERCSKLGEGF